MPTLNPTNVTQAILFSTLFVLHSLVLPFHILQMPLIAQRSLRRYIVLLFIVAIVLYYLVLSRHSTSPSPSATDNLVSERPNLASEYVKPEQHDSGQLETTLHVDRALLQQREREARRRQIDLKYCGRDRCQFVLPIAITEQGKERNSESVYQKDTN